MKWKPFPRPLVSKNPLKPIDIGPFFALREKIMMITPLTKAINRRNEWIVGGCNSEGKKRVRKKRERERKELTLRKRS